MGLRILIVVALCSLAAVLAAAVFGSEPESATGPTSEGHEITFRFGPRSEPIALETTLMAKCTSTANDHPQHWRASGDYTWDGSRLRVQELDEEPLSDGQRVLSRLDVTARMEGDVLVGSMQMHEKYELAGVIGERCSSDRVSFRVPVG